MGLAKKLGEMNAKTETQVAGAHYPMAYGGFNAQNIPNLQRSPITQQDVLQIHQVAQETQADYIQVQRNQYNLQKPNIPTGAEYPNQDVSMLIVDKMWRIICLKKLHAFYSQQSLQKPCKSCMSS